jgi:hypothetical protein
VKKLATAISASVVLLVAAPTIGAAGFTIHGDWKMGSFGVKRDGTLGGAIQTFGEPSSKARNGEVCTVRWTRHGLKIGGHRSSARKLSQRGESSNTDSHRVAARTCRHA